MELTHEQQQIVAHNKGPALVFAVAGSGKTTSMVHRIKRLVDEGVCAPNKILASSFSKASVVDIEKALSEIGVRGVRVRTLHALGFTIIRFAAQKGYISEELIDIKENQEFLNLILARKALGKLKARHRMELSQMGIDEEDFGTQISIWKANIQYADLEAKNLSLESLDVATQASHPNQFYVEGYKLYEEARMSLKWLTFDDMLLTGWEMLSEHADVLEQFQAKYEMVMIDEFQDLNRVQYETLELITRGHRNYMAIGDDDQCIYEWRGASPDFILTFEEVYGAKVYTITDNFRSTGQQVILANQVIHKNLKRYPKEINLTKGFEGNTYLMKANNILDEAKIVVQEILAKERNGVPRTKMAVLIRLYSQTPLLEGELIKNNIKYRIVGNTAFYNRYEIRVLLDYLRFVFLEKEISETGVFPESRSTQSKYIDLFKTILMAPKRYISRSFLDDICRETLSNKTSIIDELMNAKHRLHERVQLRIDDFIDVIEFLTNNISASAGEVLENLVNDIEYKDFLITLSGSKELGELKYESVKAFIEYASLNGNCINFLEQIKKISQDYGNTKKDKDCLEIMTVYRSKGLEWDTVFMIGCEDGIFPYLKPGHTVGDVEAERRLFYVGMTRAKENLYLSFSTSEQQTISRFLLESNSAGVY